MTEVRAKPPSFSHVYVFGDRYSDNGAALAFLEETVKAKISDAIELPAAPESSLYWRRKNWPTPARIQAWPMWGCPVRSRYPSPGKPVQNLMLICGGMNIIRHAMLMP